MSLATGKAMPYAKVLASFDDHLPFVAEHPELLNLAINVYPGTSSNC